ncbi:unnamed protein product [Pedinophyceae sp. YPF-701]|nr:unnamed protein product [Pedinophyceae sp. YPF-701]
MQRFTRDELEAQAVERRTGGLDEAKELWTRVNMCAFIKALCGKLEMTEFGRCMANAFFQIGAHRKWPGEERARVEAATAAVLLASKAVDELPSPQLKVVTETAYAFRYNINVNAVPDKLAEFTAAVVGWEKCMLLALNFDLLVADMQAAFRSVEEAADMMCALLDLSSVPEPRRPHAAANIRKAVVQRAMRELTDSMKTRCILMLAGREIGVAAVARALAASTKQGVVPRGAVPDVSGQPWHAVLGVPEPAVGAFNDEADRMMRAVAASSRQAVPRAK